MLLIVSALVLFALTLGVSLGLFFPNKDSVLPPECGTNHTMILFAQAVPSASKVPCVAELPLGWTVTNASVHDGFVTFGLTVGQNSMTPQVILTMTPTCEEEVGISVDLGGGCVTYHSTLPVGTTGEPTLGDGISFMARKDLVDFVASEYDQKLCGLGVPCP